MHSEDATTERSCTILLVHIFGILSNILEAWPSCHYVYALDHRTFTQAHALCWVWVLH